MNNRYLLIGLLAAIFIAIGTTSGSGQIIYKIPEGVFPMDLKESGFKGQLFLKKDSPSGLFIAFPNDAETIDQLRDRAAKFISPMVVTDSKDKAFEIKNIPSHDGDISDRGRYYFFRGEKSSVQILFFERLTTAGPVLYGYFAQKGNAVAKSDTWVGDDLKDPKILSKFIKSFSAK